MYLINAKTYALEYFVGAGIPKYVILSHVWGDEEVLFQDMKDLESAQKKKGILKIRLTCEQALQDGLKYAWVDTCCIDKESSAELSEAINSMFRWYSRAEVCYAYLADLDFLRLETGLDKRLALANSIWFTRGWTLQELITPLDVTFMDRNWVEIGTKKETLLDVIYRVTGVDKEVLKDSNAIFRTTIAKRMSWAAKRKTTRKEDEAYCLLGLFSVNMPMLYGEEEAAYVRLQEELIRKTTDQSIFAHSGSDLLASSPLDFDGRADVKPCLSAFGDQRYELTNGGLRITLPVLFSNHRETGVVLNCHRNHRRILLRLGRMNVGLSTTLSPTTSYRIEGVDIARLLTCPVEDVSIARRSRSLHERSLDALEYDSVYPLWVSTANHGDEENIEVAIKALEPPELWDVVTPVNNSVITRIGDSLRRANFIVYERQTNVGSVTFNLTDPNLKMSVPLVFEVRFEILPRAQGDAVSLVCSLELQYKYHAAHADRLEPVSHDLNSSVKEQLLSPPWSLCLQVGIAMKQLKIAVELEFIPGPYASAFDSALLLQLQVDKTE